MLIERMNDKYSADINFSLISDNLLIFTLIICLCCGDTYAQAFEVHYAGALKNFKMKNDISAKFDLQKLEGKSDLYALGAFENLKGEIQIFNSVPYSTHAIDEKIVFDATFNKKASLLVYTQIPSWRALPIPENITSQSQLETFIAQTATKSGIDARKPFPFLITGKAKGLSWHVIDWDENDSVHSHQKHIESGPNGHLENIDIDVLGFYSDKHKGIFTHHTTNIHMHFIIQDKTLAGHVDKLIPGATMHLKLPMVN